METNSRKNGGCHALDNLCNSDCIVVVRYGYGVYHGWVDPYSARNCYYSGSGKRHWRTEGVGSIRRNKKQIDEARKLGPGDQVTLPH